MKQKIYLIIILFLFIKTGVSQNFYMRPIYSASMQAFPNFYTTSEQKAIISADTIRYIDTFNSNSFSLGEGYNIGVTGGRYFNNKSEGIEISLYYFSGKKQKLSSKIHYEFDPYTAYSYSETWTEYHSMKSYNLTASYFRQFYIRNVAPFFKIGATASFIDPVMDVDLFVINTMSGYTPGKTTYFYRYQPNKDLVPGGFASAGLELFPDKTFSVTFEAFLNVMSYKPKSMTCVQYTVDDADAIEELTPSEMEIQFVDSYISTENEHENRPYQITRRNHSLSSKGIQVGIKYRF